MILRYSSQILTKIPVQQQVYIVHRRIINQPLQLAALVHIPCNLRFYQSAVNGDMLPSTNLTSTQAASILNAQEITFLSITVSS